MNWKTLQRLTGLLLLAICAACLVVCAHGCGGRDSDGTAVLLLAPMGLYLIFTQRRVMW